MLCFTLWIHGGGDAESHSLARRLLKRISFWINWEKLHWNHRNTMLTDEFSPFKYRLYAYILISEAGFIYVQTKVLNR